MFPVTYSDTDPTLGLLEHPNEDRHMQPNERQLLREYMTGPELCRKRCLGGTFRCARGRVMFEADARASTHVDFRA